MNLDKVISYLGDLTADPLQSEIAMVTIDRIRDKTPIGRLIIRLLEHAEAGKFK